MVSAAMMPAAVVLSMVLAVVLTFAMMFACPQSVSRDNQ